MKTIAITAITTAVLTYMLCNYGMLPIPMYDGGDTIVRQRWRNSLGREHLRYGAATATNDRLLRQLAAKDSMVRALLRSHKEVQSVTVVQAQTRLDTIVKVITDTLHNTIISRVDMGRWGDMSVRTRGDSSTLSLTLNDKYSVVIGYQKVSLLRRVPYAEITSDNPYTHIANARTYNVHGIAKMPRLTLSLHVGYGYTPPTRIAPYIGVGISYNIMTLWR